LCISLSVFQDIDDVAFGRGLVLLQQGDEIPRDWAILGVFTPKERI